MSKPSNRLALITIDVNNMQKGVDFWSAALQGKVDGEIGEKFTRLKIPNSSVGIFLQQVPEKKTAKTRMHLDIESDDPATEAKRLQQLGAKIIRPVPADGYKFGVLQDPFGNEFCILPT